MTLSQDKVVAGLYRLGKLLHYSRESAIYETEYGDDNKPAVIRLRRGDTPEADVWLKRWREAMELPHPNLIAVYGAGRSVVDDHAVIYVLMERAEQSLEDVLKDRTLSEQETAEMLQPTLSALQYLHTSGFSQNNLKPSQILAVGDRLKLSSDSVQSVEDGGRPADDVWAVGTVLVQALTQHLPEMDEDEGPYILRDATEPLTDVVRHCLDPDVDRRWSIEQVAKRLNLKTAAVIPPATPAPAKNGAPTAAPPVTARVEPSTPPIRPDPYIRQPEMPAEAFNESSNDDAFEERPPANNRKWIYAGLAAAVLVAGALGLARKTDPPAATQAKLVAPVAHPAVVPRPVTPSPAVDSSVKPPATAPSRQSAPSTAAGRRADGWAVIVASYSAHGPAEKRAKIMAKRFPKFQLDTFQPNSDKSHHLVILGRNLSEDDAEALRKRAVSSGLARDAYIKRLL